jgi:hypothetical protein
MYLQKVGNQQKKAEKKFLLRLEGHMTVSLYMIYKSETRIRGSGSVRKCHGSATQYITDVEAKIQQRSLIHPSATSNLKQEFRPVLKVLVCALLMENAPQA